MLHLPIPCAFAAYTTVVTPQKLCQTAYQVSCAKLTNEETVSEMLKKNFLPFSKWWLRSLNRTAP